MKELSRFIEGWKSPDFLSLINAEEGKAASSGTVPPAPDEAQPFLDNHPLGLPAPSDDSAEPHHLNTETFTEPILPIDGLRLEIQDYIRTVAEAYGCPRDYVTAVCLATASVAAGKKTPLVTNPYTNYACDFFCLVGKPSRNKTGPMMEVTRPLRAWDKKNFASYAEEKARYDQKKCEDKNCDDPAPVFHQIVAGDSSPESRNSLLAQGDMIVVIADEVKSFLDTFGRYSKGGNGSGAELSLMLSIWSNVGFAINRKTEETKLVDEPAMSVIGGIQPGLVERTFATAAMMDSGFTQRILFIYPSKGKFVKRRIRKQLSQEKRDKWEGIIGGLFNMEQMTLRLSFEAERLYSEYADNNDIKADAEEDDYIGGTIQKMNIHVLRLAIMIHLLSENWEEPVIRRGEMEYAISVAGYFTRIHIERIYPLLKPSSPEQRSMSNADLIREVFKRFKVKSQTALADALGVAQQYVNKVVNGK